MIFPATAATTQSHNTQCQLGPIAPSKAIKLEVFIYAIQQYLKQLALTAHP